MCRKTVAGVLFVLVLAAFPSASFAQAPAPTSADAAASDAPKSDDQCDRAPGRLVAGVCKTANGVADKASGAAKSVGAAAKDVADKGPVGAVASAAGDQVMAGVTAWVTETATWLAKKIVSAIDKTTDPTLDAGWFRDFYEKMVGLAALLALPMLAAVVIQAVLRQDWRLIARSVLVHVPVAFLLTGTWTSTERAMRRQSWRSTAWMTTAASIGRARSAASPTIFS